MSAPYRAAPSFGVSVNQAAAALRQMARAFHDFDTSTPLLWQSAVCSAWLHDSCPSDAHDLGCTCHCHPKESA